MRFDEKKANQRDEEGQVAKRYSAVVGMSELTCTDELARDGTGRPKAEVTDLDEASGKDMEEEAADEFLDGERDDLGVLAAEGDVGFRQGAEALIGDGDAMGIAAEIAEDLAGTGKRPLGIDDPFFLVEGVEESLPSSRVGQGGAGATFDELTFVMGGA